MKVVAFKPEHVELAQVSGYDVDKFADFDLSLFNHPDHVAGTFIHDGRIVCFAGIWLLENNIGQVWLIPTVYLKNHFIGAVKALKQYQQQLAETFKVKVLRTDGHDNPVVCRWLTWLGYTKKEDENIYVKECGEWA